MNTPICDFVENYIKENKARLHMPGHKGKDFLGFEKYDITEITGADSLYHAEGIISQSEENATSIFGSGKTFYSTEGSSHCIRAICNLAKSFLAKEIADCSVGNYILAGRNAHTAFISACVLNDIDIKWLYPKDNESYLSCVITAQDLEKALESVDKKPICVYVTSPDYLGNMCDISALSKVCAKYGTFLAVDNAHGAYLKFLNEDYHPITKGATLCCDSAHKTLPVLTGGAYLHISKDAPQFFKDNAKGALALFGSTSPSYLTLCSLDRANRYLCDGYRDRLNTFIEHLHNKLSNFAFCTLHSALSEPMKITLETKKIGYMGGDFSKILEENGIACEFYDEDFVVLMPSPENGEDIDCLVDILSSIEVKEPLVSDKIEVIPPKKVLTPRQAAFAPRELVPIECACGRILALSSVSCPPAVSLIVGGEEFNESTLELCKKYGFTEFFVVKNPVR